MNVISSGSSTYRPRIWFTVCKKLRKKNIFPRITLQTDQWKQIERNKQTKNGSDLLLMLDNKHHLQIIQTTSVPGVHIPSKATTTTK